MKDINLMPKEYIQEARKKVLNMIYIGGGILIVILVIIGVMIPYKMINDRKAILSELNIQVSDAKYKVIDEANEKLNKKEDELNSLEKLLKEVEKDSIVSRANLDLIIGFLPSEMYIERLNMDNESKAIDMEGSASEAEKVSEYVVQLSNLPFVEKVDMETTMEELDEKTVVKYQLTLQMEDAEAEGAEENDEIKGE